MDLPYRLNKCHLPLAKKLFSINNKRKSRDGSNWIATFSDSGIGRLVRPGYLWRVTFDRHGLHTRIMRVCAYYIVPVVVIAYFVLEFAQPIDTSWPSNLPSMVVNLALGGLLCYISPVLLAASYLYPSKKQVEATALVRRQARFERFRGFFIFGSLAFIVIFVSLVAQLIFPSQTDETGRVLVRVSPGYDLVLGTFINGLLTGALIALVALGYTLVYGIVELINFAHGDVFMIGSLTGFGVMSLLLGAKSSTAVKNTSLYLDYSGNYRRLHSGNGGLCYPQLFD